MNLIDTLVGALVGGLVAFIGNIYFWRWQAKKETKCLITGFAAELVLAFDRCVLYANQQKDGKVSLSGLFDFTDASVLSRLSAIIDDPELIQAIVSLKSAFYQIGRHVEEASRIMTQAVRIPEINSERKNLEFAAVQARNTALAFFDFRREKERVGIVIDRVKRLSPGKVADTLEATFLDAARKFEQLQQ